MIAVPRNIVAMGRVAHVGDEAIWLPANAPMVMTIMETT